jgi:GNAT superfamily N-acetyltransferase
MKPHIVDVDLENLHLTPKECLTAVFWELDAEGEDVDQFFQKEEWFSSTLLEWGRCGKLMVEDTDAYGFVQYAPAALFPRLRRFASGVVSDDAAYLSYCFVDEGRRSRRNGQQLVRAVAGDVVERGYRAVEAIGDRAWDGGWVLPEGFLSRCGFQVIRDDARYPLMRLDMTDREPIRVSTARVALQQPALGLV